MATRILTSAIFLLLSLFNGIMAKEEGFSESYDDLIWKNYYVIKDNGTGCAEASISSPSECKNAAASLGFTGQFLTGSYGHAPPGCHVGHPSDDWAYVYFNQHATGKLGRPIYKSICHEVTEALAVAIDNKDSLVVLITGGYVTIGTSNSVEIYDPLGLCSVNPPHSFDQTRSGFERYGHSAHYLKTGEFLLCGGLGEAGTSCSVLLGDTFKHHSNLVEPRYLHSGVVISDKLWIIGGLGGSSSTSMETLSIPGSVWSKETTQLDKERMHGCAVATTTNDILLIGGVDKDGNVIERTQVTKFNINKRDFMGLAPMIREGRSMHSCLFIPTGNQGNGRILVAGGYGGHTRYRSVLKTAQIYDIDANEWKMAGDLNKERYGGEMVMLNGRILFMGGTDGGSRLASVEEYHPENDTWTIVDQPLKTPRDWFGAAGIPRSAVGC